MKLTLHIGTHKTGSTALQEFFARNRGKLLEHGVLYPELETDGHAHHHVAWKTRSQGPAFLKDYLAAVAQKAREAGASRVLLSSEEFEFIRDKRLLEPLQEYELTVLAFLRRQDRYLESEYNQHVKMPDVRFAGDIYRFYFTHEFATRFNYRNLLDVWVNATKPAAIQLVNYDRTAKAGGQALFERALRALGVASTDGWEAASRASENASLPALATLYVAEANRRPLDREAHLRLLAACQRQFGGAPRATLLSEKDRRTLWGRFAPSNAYVINTYGLEPFEDPTSDAKLPVVDPSHVEPVLLERLVEEARSPFDARAVEAARVSAEATGEPRVGHFVIGFRGSPRVERFFAKNAAAADFELVEAVDGRSLPSGFVKQAFSEPFAAYGMKEKNAGWLAGTLGCLLSHQKALECAHARGLDYAVIAEDDAVFREPTLPWELKAHSGRYDVVFLNDGMRHERSAADGRPDVVPLLENERIGTGAVGYIVSAGAIRAIIRLLQMQSRGGLPTGFDALIQSLVVTEGHLQEKPGYRSLLAWAKGRAAPLRVGVAMPTFVGHDDEGKSIIRGAP